MQGLFSLTQRYAVRVQIICDDVQKNMVNASRLKMFPHHSTIITVPNLTIMVEIAFLLRLLARRGSGTPVGMLRVQTIREFKVKVPVPKALGSGCWF